MQRASIDKLANVRYACVLRTQAYRNLKILKITASYALVQLLAAEGRRILSDWRAMILLRRAAALFAPNERRWVDPPTTPQETHLVLHRMVERGELRRLPGLRHIYEVTVPYVPAGQVDEDEVLMEVNPYAALAYLSAMVFHGLTDEVPKVLFAIVPADGKRDQLPPGTTDKEWTELHLVSGTTPQKILGTAIHWHRLASRRFIGISEYHPRTYPVRVTTPEHTLLDGLQHPELCGGFENVFRAWVLARDTMDLDLLIQDAEMLGIAVLRQRIGFMLDELHLDHPRLENWRGRSARGGSSKLIGTAPYAPIYSERWNLSINAPIDALRSHAE